MIKEKSYLVQWFPRPRLRRVRLSIFLPLELAHEVPDVQALTDLLAYGILTVRLEGAVAADSVVQRCVDDHLTITFLKRLK